MAVAEARSNAEFAQGWRALRDKLDCQASEAKFSQWAIMELSKRYARLSSSERAAANEEIERWLAEDDETLRFDALALIGEHHIASAAPALAELAERLASDSGPVARAEREKVLRTLTSLTA
jgi:hypothetical protein